jgi:diguanylate cyclase (GGDEF)-like protein
LNPLTSLPGNPIINRVLNDSISSTTNRNVIYIDINKFKPFNDKFGFELGDQLLIETAEMLKEIIKKTFEYNSFLGHIGGDDFICVLDIPLNQAKSLCDKIISEFEKLSNKILSQQSEKTFSYICRDGNVKTFDKVGISISGVYGNLSSYKSKELLSKELGKIKKIAKSKHSSNYIISEI